MKNLLLSHYVERVESPQVRTALYLCAFSVLVVAFSQGQSPSKPFSKDDVVQLLRGSVSSKRAGDLARTRGIDFQITTEVEAELRQCGATDDLLSILRGLAPKEKPTTPVPVPPTTLLIQSIPGGTQVYVDDEPVGTTSFEGRLKLTTIAPGRHRVRLSHDGYRDFELGAVDLPLGKPVEINASLSYRPQESSQQPPPTQHASGRADGTLGGANESLESVGVVHDHSLFTVFNPWATVGAACNGHLSVSSGTVRFHSEEKHGHTFEVRISDIQDAVVEEKGGLIGPSLTLRLRSGKKYKFYGEAAILHQVRDLVTSRK